MAIALTFAGFIPYIRTIRNNKTRPHVFSWVIWSSTTIIVFLAQLNSGAGVGAWPIGVSGVITLYIAVLAYARKGDSSITAVDVWFFLLAMSSLPLWYFTADPLWSVLILTSVDILGFGPTLRKAYTHPDEENLSFFAIFTVRNIIAVLALERFSLTTALFPAVTGVACMGLIMMVVYRRQVLSSTS